MFFDLGVNEHLMFFVLCENTSRQANKQFISAGLFCTRKISSLDGYVTKLLQSIEQFSGYEYFLHISRMKRNKDLRFSSVESRSDSRPFSYQIQYSTKFLTFSFQSIIEGPTDSVKILQKDLTIFFCQSIERSVSI